ncbi:unnamed protein product [Allacma fusca]|uniref:Structural maintenance of chromosomes protein 5 n=1 Tax=Allacma fusca TaxID=39272 RepID=A0A8J2KEL6_9HEXA|nr:unnamed protein product [Allacma fusca]
MYESHQVKIVELDGLISDRNFELTMKNSEMEQLKVDWLGPLEDLIQRINDNFCKFFRQMQCVGEVTLDPGEDENNFAKYGVKIRVKFRSHEILQELGTQQSGGEKAITTALYILAIQELTKVPFRVVDEINQGMDAMNETRFFKRLCDLAQGDDTPQYFLISPKMLPPVHYPDNVDVHLVFNGEHVYTGLDHPQIVFNSSSDEMSSSQESSGSDDDSE